MRWVAFGLALAALIPAGCNSEAPPRISGNCPPFPAKRSERAGGAFASTGLGGAVRHSPPRHHVDMPAGPIDGVRIVLERSGCYGTCPQYRVDLRGDGSALFRGDGYVAFPGEHPTRVAPLAVQCLLDDFRAADFWSLDAEYVARVTDLPMYKVSLTVGGKTKTLTDYAGEAVGMPSLVTALEQAIDDAAGSDAWISGSDTTIASLEAEHFDFHGRRSADLLANAAQQAPDAVVFALLDHGAPLDGLTTNGVDDENRMSAIEAAAMNGRLAVVRRLIGAGAFAKGGKALIDATLRASVASRNAAMVAEILKYHPDVNSPDKRGDTALALVFTGAHTRLSDEGSLDEDAAIIRMLGKAGANPNLPNSEHADLLRLAFSKDDKDALIAIGANQPRRSGR